LQDKEEALQALAAAAAAAEQDPTTSSSSRHCLTEAEKQALRDSGKQARDAESRQLAARVESSDAALRRMSQQGREQWFQVRRCVGVCSDLDASNGLDDRHAAAAAEIAAAV
jgi:hypothetical protein